MGAAASNNHSNSENTMETYISTVMSPLYTGFVTDVTPDNKELDHVEVFSTLNRRCQQCKFSIHVCIYIYNV